MFTLTGAVTQASTPIMDLELCSFDMMHCMSVACALHCQDQSCSGIRDTCRDLEGKDSDQLEEPGALHADATARSRTITSFAANSGLIRCLGPHERAS